MQVTPFIYRNVVKVVMVKMVKIDFVTIYINRIFIL
jgi:hypothetical protein